MPVLQILIIKMSWSYIDVSDQVSELGTKIGDSFDSLAEAIGRVADSIEKRDYQNDALRDSISIRSTSWL